MASILNQLQSKKILRVTPGFVPETIQYEVVMGSVAHGVSGDSSDMDIYGYCVPPRPHPCTVSRRTLVRNAG